MPPTQLTLTDSQQALLAQDLATISSAQNIQAMRSGQSMFRQVVAQAVAGAASPPVADTVSPAGAVREVAFPELKFAPLPYAGDVAALIAALNHQAPPAPPKPQYPPQLGAFNTGYITFDGGCPVGGWATLTLYEDGSCTFSGSFHDSGAPSYNDDFGWVIVDAAGTAYTFSHQGHLAGTFEPGSRDDSWTTSGKNAAIANGWANLCKQWTYHWVAGVNWDVQAAINSAVTALKDVGTVVAAVVAIV